MAPCTDLVALSLLSPSIQRAAFEQLRGGEPPGAVLDHLVASRQTTLRDEREAIACDGLRERAERAVHEANDRGIRMLAWSDPDFPAALAAIVDPPLVLWTRGDLRSLDRPAVALVGSRAASPHAVSVAEQLGRDLAASGITVVSGLARGVDSAAHRGALDAPGRTVAVLGSGVDVIYPAEHTALAREIETMGLLVSELVPGTRPLPFFFPLRNRIISGLSRAVVVVEAGEKSGSLITARLALDQGRDVLAVPGNVLSGRNRGAHGLLRDGAKIVESADDILEELGMRNGVVGARSEADEKRRGRALSSDPVLACLSPGEPADLDALAERSGLTASRLLTRLFELELQGAVRRAGGGRFVRIDRSC